MWTEPLPTRARDLDDYRFIVEATDAAGTLLAAADALVNRTARCGYLAELRVIDATGTARQRRRALVLLVREACRHAQAFGITSVHTETTAALRSFGERLAGSTGSSVGPRFRIAGDLSDIRSHLLAVTDADGNDS
jgi:hypothetical protein